MRYRDDYSHKLPIKGYFEPQHIKHARKRLLCVATLLRILDDSLDTDTIEEEQSTCK